MSSPIRKFGDDILYFTLPGLVFRLLYSLNYNMTLQMDYIRIRGAAQHNLKNINLDIPRVKLVVITGVSGSGKSSLAFDTIY
ncbi:MAG: hypothetical protein NT140_00230, partial [Deltaproteobacteria bacterium]|nr:hypothetical protein [Deltaproteobacteria bacterium]